ncbi:MAG: sugar nucleotide-binding protein, partial [Bacteroidaceae bacterium]|nr:sugar nucleotide-binding protein [Bacteroidaceae bacterium]
MNILVTGACGQLGCMIRSIAPGSRHRFIFADIAEAEGLETLRLDVTDEAALRRVAEQEAVEVIVNCAGYTNVDGAESEPELAERLNAAAPALMARIMQERGGLLIHPSTDYVFGGEPHCTPYDESQPCSPLGIYGISKLHG